MAGKQISDNGKSQVREAHQARTRTNDRRERVQYIHGRIQTLCQPIAAVVGVIESGGMLS